MMFSLGSCLPMQAKSREVGRNREHRFGKVYAVIMRRTMLKSLDQHRISCLAMGLMRRMIFTSSSKHRDDLILTFTRTDDALPGIGHRVRIRILKRPTEMSYRSPGSVGCQDHVERPTCRSYLQSGQGFPRPAGLRTALEVATRLRPVPGIEAEGNDHHAQPRQDGSQHLEVTTSDAAGAHDPAEVAGPDTRRGIPAHPRRGSGAAATLNGLARSSKNRPAGVASCPSDAARGSPPSPPGSRPRRRPAHLNDPSPRPVAPLPCPSAFSGPEHPWAPAEGAHDDPALTGLARSLFRSQVVLRRSVCGLCVQMPVADVMIGNRPANEARCPRPPITAPPSATATSARNSSTR